MTAKVDPADNGLYFYFDDRLVGGFDPIGILAYVGRRRGLVQLYRDDTGTIFRFPPFAGEPAVSAGAYYVQFVGKGI
jgi:hypothetical protein